jgi:hypothetical protein
MIAGIGVAISTKPVASKEPQECVHWMRPIHRLRQRMTHQMDRGFFFFSSTTLTCKRTTWTAMKWVVAVRARAGSAPSWCLIVCVARGTYRACGDRPPASLCNVGLKWKAGAATDLWQQFWQPPAVSGRGLGDMPPPLAGYCRHAHRQSRNPTSKNGSVGFRCCQRKDTK